MRREIRDVLDKEQAGERRKVLVTIAGLLALAVLFGAVYVPVEVKTVYGTMEAYTGEQTEMGSKERVTVQLESGEKILAKVPQHLSFMRNRKVEVVEKRALLGRRSYSVIKYVE